MNQLSRRDFLGRTGSALPFLVVSGLARGQQEAGIDTVIDTQISGFLNLSAMLTGYTPEQLIASNDLADVASADTNLAAEYYIRLSEFLADIGHPALLRNLIQNFRASPDPEAFVYGVMSNDACKSTESSADRGVAITVPPLAQTTTPGVIAQNKTAESGLKALNLDLDTPAYFSQPAANANANTQTRAVDHLIIENWQSTLPEGNLLAVQQLAAADYQNPDNQKCLNTFLCQDIIAIWYASALFHGTPPDHTGNAPNFGSAGGYVGSLVWQTVGGEFHPYAQCGGEFGYWSKVPSA